MTMMIEYLTRDRMRSVARGAEVGRAARLRRQRKKLARLEAKDG